MRSLLSLIVVTGLMVTSAQAQHQPPLPVPDGEMTVDAGTVELFHCVKIEDPENIHPCAVPKVIMVPDPCAKCCDPCNCCEPACVAIQICVPPCDCCGQTVEQVRCSKDGRRQKYCYGKYSVEVTVKKGYVKVDYDD